MVLTVKLEQVHLLSVHLVVFTFPLKLCPVLLPQVYLPAERLPLSLQFTPQHGYAQLHALPLFLLFRADRGE